MEDSEIDRIRERHSYWIVIIGLLVVTVTFSISVWKWTTAADVATVMGSVTGVVGTLVGAFLGFKIGSQGREKADEDRREAQDQVAALSAHLPAEKVQNIMQTLHARKTNADKP